jgi:hypothetical protein
MYHSMVQMASLNFEHGFGQLWHSDGGTSFANASFANASFASASFANAFFANTLATAFAASCSRRSWAM